MKYRIEYLPDTVTDREAIREYLTRYYEGTPRRFFSLLKEKIGRLKEFPYSCPVYEDDPDYRRLVVENYLVFYMVREDERIVEIHRILHGSRNISKIIREPADIPSAPESVIARSNEHLSQMIEAGRKQIQEGEVVDADVVMARIRDSKDKPFS